MDYVELDSRFAAAFRFARLRSSLSQAEVAAAMREYGFDMSQPVVGKIERGDRKVSIGEAEALAAVIGRSLHSLLRGEAEIRLSEGEKFLQARIEAVKEALARFQGAQLAAAMALDTTDISGASAYVIESIEHQLAITPADIVREFEKDTIAETQSMRLRDELDAADEGMDLPPRVSDDLRHIDSLAEQRGDAINLTMGALGFMEAQAALFVEVKDDAAPTDPAE